MVPVELVAAFSVVVSGSGVVRGAGSGGAGFDVRPVAAFSVVVGGSVGNGRARCGFRCDARFLTWEWREKVSPLFRSPQRTESPALHTSSAGVVV